MNVWKTLRLFALVLALTSTAAAGQSQPVPSPSVPSHLRMLPAPVAMHEPTPPRFDSLGFDTSAEADLSFLEPAPTYHPTRFWAGVGTAGALDAVFMTGLASIWYDEATRTSFHFYSDSDEATEGGRYDDGWLDDWHTFAQQDKLGHVWTSWHVTRIVGEYGRWAGLSPGRAALFGGIVSTVFQTQVEVADGFDEQYGFSRTDALANVVGSTVGGLKVAYPEKMGWFAAKYSYNPSPYYGTTTTGVDGGNPLGYLGNAIKDYDGITYWLAVRPDDLLQGRAQEMWPDWLGVAVGYGGDGLAHARSGLSYGDSPPDPNGYEHRRELYIGPDIDLLHTLDLPQPFRAVARFFEFVRLPAPALQLTPEVRWYWVFY